MNPELERLLWLEASGRRLLWAAVALAAIYGATLLLVGESPLPKVQAFGAAGAVVFGACAFLWAPRAAANAVLEEVRERTWDFQRQSALGAWELTFGKLAGATALPWACAASGVVALAPAAVARNGWSGGALSIGWLIAAAVLVQAFSLLITLLAIRRARISGRATASGGVLGGLVLGGFLLWTAGSTDSFRNGAGLEWLRLLQADEGLAAWWGLITPAPALRLAAVLVLACLAGAGAWRAMRLELQMRTVPLVWPVFLCVVALLAGGAPYLAEGLGSSLQAGGLALCLSAYAAAFAEPLDHARLRRLLAARSPQALWAETPASVLSILAAGLLMAAGFAALPPGAVFWGWQGLALVGFVARDVAVVFWRRLAAPGEGDLSALIVVGLLHVLGAALGPVLSAFQGEALFAPRLEAPILSLASGLVQTAVALWLCARELRTVRRPEAA